MKNKTIAYGVGLLVLVVVLCAVFILQGYFVTTVSKVAHPAGSDDMVISALLDGDHLLTDKTAGYQLNLPRTWYFEKNAGRGVTLYPNYDPAAASSPECKIEISTLPNPSSVDLSDWLTTYFQGDPTADVQQVSLAQSMIGGSPAIIWTGSENGVSTTLAYVAQGKVVYEIAPSIIEPNGSGAGDRDSSDAVGNCEAAFQALFSTFQFLPQ